MAALKQRVYNTLGCGVKSEFEGYIKCPQGAENRL